MKISIVAVIFTALIVTALATSKQRSVISFKDRDILSSDELLKCREHFKRSVFDKKDGNAVLPLTQCMHADYQRVKAEEWNKLFVHAQLIDNASPSLETRYAMALMQHHLHRPDQAWRFLLAAKAQQEKFPIDASRDQNAILARIGGGTSFWTGLGPKSKVPIFVVGMSERTVVLPLLDLLSKHDRILLAPQNLSVFESHHAEVWASAAASYRDGEGTVSMSDAAKQSAALLLSEYNELIQRMKPNAKHVLDVSFHNYKSIGFLHMHFPSALIIHVVRDPLDTILDTFLSSDIDSHAYSADVHTAAAEYSEYVKLMLYWRQALPRGRLLEVSHESLTESDASRLKIVREILAKLKLSSDDTLLKSKPRAYTGLPSGVWVDYKQFLEPIRKQLLKELGLHFETLSRDSSLSEVNWRLEPARYVRRSDKKTLSVLDDDEYYDFEEYSDEEDEEDGNEEYEYNNFYENEDENVYDEDEDAYDEYDGDEDVYDEHEDAYDEDDGDEDAYYEYEDVYDEDEDAYDEYGDEDAYDEYEDAYDEYDGDEDAYYEYEDVYDDEEDLLLQQSDDIRYLHSPSTVTGDFAKIGMQCGTDKATRHGYYRYYPRFTEHLRKAAGGAMLEIGVNQEHSLCLWLQYFPKAFVYGIDVNVTGSGDRYKIFKMDQSKRSDLEKLVSRKMLAHPIFLVVDDGSHIPEHQLLSFDVLFSNVLKPGGTYVIEDVETSYWRKYGVYGYETHYGYHHKKSTVEMFKYIADEVNFECLNAKSKAMQDSLINGVLSTQTRKMISSVTFAQNTVIITKKTVAEQKKYGYREYPYAVAL